MTYIVKNARGEYADGSRRWRKKQRKAFRFYTDIVSTGREWAQSHAKTFAREGIKARAVRLVPRRVR